MVVWSDWRKGGLWGPGSSTRATQAGAAISSELLVKPVQCWGSVVMLSTSLCSLALLEQSSPDLCLLTCKNPHYQPFCLCHRSHLICSSSPRPHSQRLLIMQKSKASFLITSCSLRAAGADLKRRDLKLKRQIGSEGCLFNILVSIVGAHAWLVCCCARWSCFAEWCLGHFPVLSAVRGDLYMFQVWRHSWSVSWRFGEEHLMKIQWLRCSASSLLPICNKAYCAFTLQVNLFFLKLQNMRKAPNCKREALTLMQHISPFAKGLFFPFPCHDKKA